MIVCDIEFVTDELVWYVTPPHDVENVQPFRLMFHRRQTLLSGSQRKQRSSVILFVYIRHVKSRKECRFHIFPCKGAMVFSLVFLL